MSIITKVDKIQELLDNTSNIRDAVDAIIIYLDKPFTEKYNKGIANGESEGQAIVSALGATVVEYGLELNGITGTALSIAELYYGKDKVEQWTDELYNDVDGAIDSLFDRYAIDREQLDEIPDATINSDREPYTIQTGDTLSQIAQTNNTTIDKIIEDNPWLTEENRISQDGSYALIKPGEKLNLTVDDKTTTYGIDENSTISPEYQIDLTTNTVIPLQPNQTISHIAANTEYNSIDLLEYNNLTLEQAKSLPVGFEVQIPKSVNTYNGMKVFENHDGSYRTTLTDSNGNKQTYFSSENESSVLKIDGDISSPDKITLIEEDGTSQIWEKNNNGEYINITQNPYETQTAIDTAVDTDNTNTNTDTTTTVEPDTSYGSYDSDSQTISYTDENGNTQQLTYNENNDLLIYGDPSNPDKITFTDPSTGEYQENLLLNTFFVPTSALPQKKHLSLSLLNSNILFYQSLDLEKNRVSNNRFYGMREVA